MNSPFARARHSIARHAHVAGWTVAGVVLSVSLAAAAEGYLGIYMQEVTASLRRGMDLPRGAGVLVSDVQEDSPADKAGVHEGDVITEIDGHSVGSPDDIREAVQRAGAGHRVSLTVWRDGDERTVSVTLGSREAAAPEQRMRVPPSPDDEGESDEGTPRRETRIQRHRGGDDEDNATPAPRAARGGYLGVGLADLTPQLGAYFGVRDGGVLVTNVEDDSPADDAGIKAGDVIIGIGNDDVDSAADLRSAIRGRKPGASVTIRVMRDRSATTLDAKLGTAPRDVSMLGNMGMGHMLQGMQGLRGLEGLQGLEGLDREHLDSMMKEWHEKVGPGKKGEPRIFVLPRTKELHRDGGDADMHQQLDRLRAQIDDLQKQIDEDQRKGDNDNSNDNNGGDSDDDE